MRVNRVCCFFQRSFYLIVALSLLSCTSAAQLPKLSPHAVILAFGDSLTYGTGVTADQSYPAVLARLSAHRVINAGIAGETSGSGLARLPALLDDTQPELLILCHAANDILRSMPLAQAEMNLRKMVALAEQRGIAVMIVAVPKFSIILSAADFYAVIARDMHIPIEADILSSILADRTLKSDQIHPNEQGYRLMAAAVFDLMQQAGAL